jgi:hypothetical protein
VPDLKLIGGGHINEPPKVVLHDTDAVPLRTPGNSRTVTTSKSGTGPPRSWSDLRRKTKIRLYRSIASLFWERHPHV